MDNNSTSQEWTDGERIKLASTVLNSAFLIEQKATEGHAELLEVIRTANAVLTLPAEELSAVTSR